MKSKYSKYKDRIIEIHEEKPLKPYAHIARQIIEETGIHKKAQRSLRRYVKHVVSGLPVNYNKREFIETQRRMNQDGNVISTVEKLQSAPLDIPADHEIAGISTNLSTGQQWIKTRKKEWKPEDDETDYLAILKEQLDGHKPKLLFDLPKVQREGVIALGDLHFGAYISALKVAPDFNITILCDMLEQSAMYVNRFGYEKVHVHLLGDLIESFTGLNHKNSWKGLEKGMFGVKAIKLFCELFESHFLEKVANLGEIKIIAGNHDRVTSDNKEDVDGGAAEIIAWGLEMMGYYVEFSPSVITHQVDGICYILNHGHLDLTRRLSTEEICWKYGKKGMFNFILEAHLHTRIRKLSATALKNFKMVSDDNNDCRRQVIPSLFTGNAYSEYGGWSSNPGCTVIENNGKGKPNVFDFAL